MHLEILQEKYGEEICNQLLEDGKLKPVNIIAKKEQSQRLVKKQISKINNLLDLGLDIENTDWAFDFSGWLGSLTRNSESKKYMIIGLEPHIEHYDYQIVYGLSDNNPEGKKRFQINDFNGSNPKEQWDLICHGDSSIIWSVVLNILATEKQKNNILNNKDEKELYNFLNQFYITDLCHFAPQGKANKINNIPGWKKIRKKVAAYYLKKEIDAVKPKVILTQGNCVFKELLGPLKFKETESYPLNYNGWSIKTGIDSKGKYKVLSIPHFGTELNYKTFYKKHIDAVREILKSNNLI